MSTIREKIAEFEAKLKEIQQMGGSEQVAKQKGSGKLTARERLDLLFDSGTFVEVDAFVRHRAEHFGMSKREIPSDGVVTGYGLVNGRKVFSYAQDFTAQAGTLGEMHSTKICKIMDLALKVGAPVVGFNDSGGARIQEGVDALTGYGRIFFRNASASGVVPQISAIMGPCAGGAVYSPAMTDFVFMTEKTSYMFITGPKVIKAVTGEDITPENLGGAYVHASVSGVAHFIGSDDAACIASIRDLLSYFPSNNAEDPPIKTSDDPLDRESAELDDLIPDDPRQSYDMRTVLRAVVDDGVLMEPHALYAQNMIVAFGRVAGMPVGIIANQPLVKAGCLDVDASDKATRFIRFCDAFNIPMLTFADVPGYLPGVDQERNGIIRHGAKLLWCYSEATVPKITIIVRKDFGGSYIAMCSRDLGADIVLAWPTAEIAVMGAEGAAEILFAKDIKTSADPKATLSEKVLEYRMLFANPYIAAQRGYVDAIIRPCKTRAEIAKALLMLRTKREARPPKKHGNIPV